MYVEALMIIFPVATDGDGLGIPSDAVIKQPYTLDTFNQ